MMCQFYVCNAMQILLASTYMIRITTISQSLQKSSVCLKTSTLIILKRARGPWRKFTATDLSTLSTTNDKYINRLYQRVRLRGERIGPQEFNEYARSNPALFFPAFDMQRKIRQQVIGIVFWKNKARVRALKCAADSCPRIKDLPDIFTQKHDSFDLEVDTTVTENSLCQNSGKGSVRGGSEPPVYPKGSPEQ